QPLLDHPAGRERVVEQAHRVDRSLEGVDPGPDRRLFALEAEIVRLRIHPAPEREDRGGQQHGQRQPPPDGHEGKRLRPGQMAIDPSSSSIRSNWWYFAPRSVRDALPVLIWPALVATARSAMKVSSVSPERCELITPKALVRASSIASRVSVS